MALERTGKSLVSRTCTWAETSEASTIDPCEVMSEGASFIVEHILMKASPEKAPHLAMLLMHMAAQGEAVAGKSFALHDVMMAVSAVGMEWHDRMSGINTGKDHHGPPDVMRSVGTTAEA